MSTGYQQANLEELLLSSGGAVFPIDGTGVYGMGEADDGTVSIEPFNPITIENREFLTMYNHKYSKKTMQMGADFMKFLLGAYKANDVTVKAVTSGIIKDEAFTASGGIFTHENTKSMGLDFEIELSPKNRSIIVTAEKAYPVATTLAIVAASKIDTVPISVHLPALDAANTLKAYISPSFGAGITIAEDRLDDWFYKIKTRTTKNGFNHSRGKMIDVEINAVLDGADPDEAAALLAAGYLPDITLAIGVTIPYNIVFKSGGLTRTGKFNITKDKRGCTAILKGSYSTEYMDLTGAGIILNAQL